MPSFFASAAALALAATALAAPAPQVTQAASLDKRAGSCTFSGSTGAAAVSKSKASCATITLSNIAVPSGTTLDLTKLTKGTKVIFEGTTSFGYKEWSGPLISVSGDSLTVSGASGHVIDGNGAKWWDGEGTNGGKTKPKFFYAHSMTNSVIENLNVKNTPVQGFSVNSATNLQLVRSLHLSGLADDSDS